MNKGQGYDESDYSDDDDTGSKSRMHDDDDDEEEDDENGVGNMFNSGNMIDDRDEGDIEDEIPKSLRLKRRKAAAKAVKKRGKARLEVEYEAEETMPKVKITS